MQEIDLKAIATRLGIDSDAKSEEELAPKVLRGLAERHELLDRLSNILRSISHRAPLREVLDAITRGASELMGDEVVGLRLLDPDDPEGVVLVSSAGLSLEQHEELQRGRRGEGVGGQAIEQDELVIVYDYEHTPRGTLELFRKERLQAAMAAPVHERGQVVGSLTVASYDEDRRYSSAEQEILLSFAAHASVALTDAKTVETLRHAQHSKDMFFAMASHELKTPLTVIMGTLRTIEKHQAALTGHVRAEMLASAYERGRELKDLIDRMLQGARAELAGTKRVVFLPDLVRDATRGFDQSRVRIDDIPTISVETDDGAVKDALGVFIENAFTHAPDGSEIGVETSVVDSHAKITVRNEGQLPEGLDPNELFEPFIRGTDSKPAGVGLGLYIAARLADAIDGQIEVNSEDNSVAFSLTFPTKVAGSGSAAD
ncbi:MAG: GAF domain-containing sensor histidine kinase [Actinomycetota bacterium]|nr:GAF domain-containing sensor histidine kinase [Actinomycetota bacterium]